VEGLDNNVCMLPSFPSHSSTECFGPDVSTEKKFQRRTRRSREEIERLITDYEASAMRPNEYCRKHGLPPSTLQRHRKRRRLGQVQIKADKLFPLTMRETDLDGDTQDAFALAVVLSNGWRIEVRPNFDPNTLKQLLSLLGRVSPRNDGASR